MIGALLVIALFAAPPFAHLADADEQNDGASHSYSVERILETGTWLTPEAIPHGDYVEKPPLKFWLTAGAMRLGLLPRNDFGMRFFDALFGAVAFLYVYAFGCRLDGPVAGLAAVLVLFLFAPVLFGHGVLTNNMESVLLLAYAAGVWHFVSWIEAPPAGRRRTHASLAAVMFVLGFMTKFVAVLFLPVVCAAAVLADRRHRQVLRARWREWIGPIAAAGACILPWFVYQTARMGTAFWSKIVGEHVVTRFTTGLDPSHLEPWTFYFTAIWREWAAAGAAWLVAAGVVFLIVRAASPRGWLARVLLCWALVPLTLISIGSSKIVHYAIPFLPPLALGAGWLVGAALGGLRRAIAQFVPSPRVRLPAAIASILRATGWVAAAVLAWMVWVGPLSLAVAPGVVLKGHSILRPAVAAGVLLLAAGGWRDALLWAVAIPAALVLTPVRGYAGTMTQLQSQSHPLRTLAACVRDQVRAGRLASPETFAASPLVTHAYFYYFRTLGPFVTDVDGRRGSLRSRLLDPDRQAIVVTAAADYRAWLATAVRGEAGLPERLPIPIRVEPDFVILLPGPYGACTAPAIAAGAIVADDRVR